MMSTVWLASAVTALFATVAVAVGEIVLADDQPIDRPICATTGMVDKGLHEAGERPVWRGTAMDGSALAIYSREDGATWSVVAINDKTGIACVVQIGSRGAAIVPSTRPLQGEKS